MEIKTNINSYNVPILNARIHEAVAVKTPPLWGERPCGGSAACEIENGDESQPNLHPATAKNT
jgi:hypothetical protein